MVDFTKALRLTTGQTSTEGGYTRRVLAGQLVYVSGWFRIQTGVTRVDIGIEAVTEALASAATALYNPTLPAVNTWTFYEGYVTVPSGKVWSRPYLASIGGTTDFAEIYTAPAAETRRIAPLAVNETVRAYTGGSTGTGAVNLQTVTVVTASANEVPEIIFSGSCTLNGTGASFIYLERASNGGAGVSVEGGVMKPKGASGDIQTISITVVDTAAPVGSHVYTWKQSTGPNHNWDTRLMIGKRIKR